MAASKSARFEPLQKIPHLRGWMSALLTDGGVYFTPPKPALLSQRDAFGIIKL
jgi:hypothetical protein